MNKMKLLTLLIVILLNSGCASFRPTIRIETLEPAEDFVVLCEWYRSGIISHGGGRSLSDQKIFITESGKEVDCGLSWIGGEVSGASILHPLYTNMQGVDEDGVSVIRPKSKRQILDEQKEKFEAGYWDKNRNPGSRYAEAVGGCGFPYQYLDYYSQVKKVDKQYLKEKYNDIFLECKKRVIPIRNKYLPHTYSGERPTAEKSMENLWNSKGWDKYQ